MVKLWFAQDRGQDNLSRILQFEFELGLLGKQNLRLHSFDCQLYCVAIHSF
jgi:hypothetical protein